MPLVLAVGHARAVAAALALIALSALPACTGVRPGAAPPAEIHEDAQLPGFSDVRVWGDETPPDAERSIRLFAQQIRDEARRAGGLPNGGRLESLVLSGGGSDGPYGAGVLAGWTELGDRPEFGVVTGISAGALIAPFAFLGPDYDDEMHRFVVEGSTDDLVAAQIFSGLIDGIGLFDNAKLRRKLRGMITPDVVRAIAAEHDKGRRLLVGTTDLDAQRPRIWRIDAIAKQGLDDPEATADLITKIIIASASIPGAFPPQFFTVEAGGERYDEMHVDGGVTHQLFYLPLGEEHEALAGPEIARYAREGTIHVIRNTKLLPDYEPVAMGLPQIGSRAMSTLIKYSGRGDIASLNANAQRLGLNVRVTAVPDSFDHPSTELFDPAYMRALYELGRERALAGEAWSSVEEAEARTRSVPSKPPAAVGG